MQKTEITVDISGRKAFNLKIRAYKIIRRKANQGITMNPLTLGHTTVEFRKWLMPHLTIRLLPQPPHTHEAGIRQWTLVPSSAWVCMCWSLLVGCHQCRKSLNLPESSTFSARASPRWNLSHTYRASWKGIWEMYSLFFHSSVSRGHRRGRTGGGVPRDCI